MEAFMWRHQPRVACALAMLAAGELGEYDCETGFFRFEYRPQRLAARFRPGGAVYDLGC